MMMDFFKKYFYRYKIEYNLRKIDCAEYISILKKYDKFWNPEELEVSIKEDSDECCEYATVPNESWVYAIKGDDDVYDIYYKNIRISIIDKEGEKVVRVSLKKREDEWNFVIDDGKVNYSKPINKTVEIYREFDKEYMGENFYGEHILKGNWNYAASSELDELNDIILGFTDIVQVNDSYSN